LTSGITKLENPEQSVFTFATPQYYWRFTTGNNIDTTPPQISSVIPRPNAGIDPEVIDRYSLDNSDPPKVYLNQIVAVNFNEPVIPPIDQTQNCTEADVDNEAQLTLIGESFLTGCSTFHIPGEWRVGLNNYRTMQFISNTDCEGNATNSCGEIAKCLPADSTLAGTILAAQIVGEAGVAGTGIMDMAGNSLDGNYDGTAQGPAADNYSWQFATGNALDLTAPQLLSLSPDHATQVQADQILKATFDEALDAQSVDQNVFIYGEDYASWVDPNLDSHTEQAVDQGGQLRFYENGDPVMVNVVDMEIIAISHGPFTAFDPQKHGDTPPLYAPVIKSQVKDLRQNCFSPTKSSNICTNNVRGDSCCPNLDADQFIHTQVSDSEICPNLPGR